MITKDALKKQQTDSLKAFSEKHRADFNKLQNILKAIVDKGLLSKRIPIAKTIENLFEQSQM